ncbi:ABC transporter C family member 3-like [Mangifera indica]|uniref:ABC transporter C family member 3-like n=1 Tax=Mangifera indica TaxID=29780 RepID=UPI001CFB3620|nr:ABC transporter C family member 3-like [Mangifera indica]
MKLFHSTSHEMLTFFTLSSSLMDAGTGFLLKPMFLHGFSASLHLVLLLGLIVCWVRKKLKVSVAHESTEDSKERWKSRSVLWYKKTLVCCLSVSVFNLVLCLLSYFYWYRNDWSDDNLVTLSDLVLRTLGWGAISVYLRTQFFNSGKKKFPFLLRTWWGFYMSISCYCLVIHIVLYNKKVSVPIQYVVSDVFSVITGLFFCYLGFLRKHEGEDTILLQEPLLDGNSASDDAVSSIKTKGADKVTPYSNASLISSLTFSWISSLIADGNKKTLDLDDVPQLDSRDSVLGAFPIFRNKLQAECGTGSKVTTLALVKALFFYSWKDILVTAFLALLYTSATYVGPFLIDTFVQYLNGKQNFEHEGYVLVSTFFVAKLVECLSRRRWIFRLQQVGVRVRAVIIAMVYNKGLTLSCQAMQGHTSGEIINFMTVDAERLGDFMWYIHDPWLVIVQVGLAFLILYKNLGLASVATVFGTIIVMLANFPFWRMQEKFQDKLMESKDKRMKATSEILRNMRILKLQGWEMKFLSKIIELRKTEAGWLKKQLFCVAMANFIFWNASSFLSVVTFGACMILGIPLSSGKILSAIATFRILQVPMYALPDTISMIIQTKVSLDRIAAFLCLDDLQSDVVERLPRGSSDTALEIIDGNFSWDLTSPNKTLKDINLKVLHGMKVAVCGIVGSGKSSLLSCILGEIPKSSGILKLCGTKAYVAQSPWIQSGTIQENILFGKEMDRVRYDVVLEACSLKKDLEIFAFGDQTVIGERGINLSGGQKQRIQIARAIYQDADVYMFDDPFSAVDAHTGSHLFKEVLLGLLRSKTVIYVTHQVEFLPTADLILVMKDGKISQAGKYGDILNSGTDFMELVGAHKQALSAIDAMEGELVSKKNSESVDQSSSTSRVGNEEENKNDQNDKSDEVIESRGQLVQEEEREKGKVGFSVYWKYITIVYGGALVPFVLLAQVLFQTFQLGSNYWIAWATPVSEEMKPPVGSSKLIIVYAILAIGSSFCLLARNTLVVTNGYIAARWLFSKMHMCIFRAPMSFFDATPSGRILNRASTDQSAVDLNVPMQIGGFAFGIIQLLAIIIVMSQVAWQAFIVFIPVISTCIWYQQYYISSARELSRLVGVCKAPVIQHFAETISGTTTIRSFDQESRFQNTNMKLMDGYSRPKFHVAGAMEWLSFRLDVLSSVAFALSLVLLISVPDGVLNAAIAGLAVTYGLNLNTLQASVIWNLCQLENKIISVERMLQYTRIPSEPPLVIEESRPDPSWPSYGEVSMHYLQVRYAPHLPLVLRGLTCTFLGGMKTGIVGRTGSGKSTLIQTLFRIVEPAAGQIMIDAINISSIGLHDLRSRLSIIPQEPTMFEGTVRSNLDPLEEYTDEEIWEALEKCQLAEEVRKKETKLDSKVIENGENWSMGQRQLVCLGRVLLKKSKVLVLDEATASVDTATDNLIQQTLRQHFSDCTVITIAHRITSVLDSDMVLLLSQGLIEEYDSPAKLLENKSSSFAQLVAEYSLRSNSSSYEKLAGN